MSDDRDPITGPIPIYVRTTPLGVVLDMDALRALIVADVIDELLNAEDTTAWDLLHQAADPETAGEFDGELLEQHLNERASSRVPLTPQAALNLTRQLRMAAAPKTIPSQREAGAA